MEKPTSPCPIERSDPVVGDRYVMRILRELFSGNTSFEEIQAQADITPQMASTRLKKMVATGLVERRRRGANKRQRDYILTEMGKSLFPVLLALREWGETWQKDADEGAATRYIHKPCGRDPGLSAVCPHCLVPLAHDEVETLRSPEWRAVREARHSARFKKAGRT